jgi:hypothetical protein
MRIALFTLPCLLLLGTAPGAAVADERGAAAGAVTGAVAGAIVGGPVGAVIGAAIGGVVVGTATTPDALASAEVAPPAPIIQERVLVRRQADRRRGPNTLDPATTGSVVETTCIQDARGNRRCRNEAVR